MEEKGELSLEGLTPGVGPPRTGPPTTPTLGRGRGAGPERRCPDVGSPVDKEKEDFRCTSTALRTFWSRTELR